MKQSTSPITLTLDSSTLGEFREAMAALAELPPETYVTFTGAIEIRFDQIGSRATAINAYPSRTDEKPDPGIGKPNRAARRRFR